MATTVTKTSPLNGLCKKCANQIKVLHFGVEAAPDTKDLENPAGIYCSEIDKLDLMQYLTDTLNDEQGNLTSLDTNISNCNLYVPAAYLEITTVAYDAGIPQLEVTVSLETLAGTPNIEFYFFGTQAPISTQAGVAGSSVYNIAGALADGTYYLYAKLSTGESSTIYPFIISTS